MKSSLLSRGRRFIGYPTGIGAALCLILSVTAWGPPDQQRNSGGKVMPADAAPLDQQVFRQILIEPPTLDIGVTLYDARFMTFVFEPLTVFNEDVELAPAAAERWFVSDDKKTWTFIIREGARWSDGRPLTAQDFVWSFQRLVDPDAGNVYASLYYPIKGAREFNTRQTTDRNTVGVRAVDERTLTIETVEPCSYLPMIVSFFTSVPAPRWQIEKYGVKWTEAGRLVNNSTWALDTWTQGSGMTFRQNPNYVGDHKAFLERFHITFAPREFNDVLAYENGEIDAAQVDPTDYLRVKNHPELSKQLLSYPDFGTFYLFFQTRKPPFDDVRVRQAFAKAIDQEVISRVVLNGMSAPAYGMTPPGFVGYDAERLKPHQGFDPARARQLLAEAGYPNGRGFPRLALQVRQPTPTERTVSVAVQQMLKDHLNVQIDLEEKTMAVFNDRMVKQDIPFGFVWFYADYFDMGGMVDPPWRYRPAGSGRQDWHNDLFEQLIDRAAGTFDDARRIALYQDAEEILAEDASGVFLYHSQLVQLMNPRIRGIDVNKHGYRRWGRFPPDYARIYFSR